VVCADDRDGVAERRIEYGHAASASLVLRRLGSPSR
jgi:hypothetical protein